MKFSEMAKLESNQYGKCRVRVLKVMRGKKHKVCELEVDVLLRGDLDGSYFSEDNSSIVPTDTVKNTVHTLAHDYLGTCRVSFTKIVGEYFLNKYEHLDGATVEVRERRWGRMEIDGEEHPHAFSEEANGTWMARGEFDRDEEPMLSAGITDHLIMKTTESGFEGFNTCDLTTLPPTSDRIFSTRMTAEWFYDIDAQEYKSADETVLQSAHKIFATTYSPSVQRTLFEIGEAALAATPSIEKIALNLPNVHFLGMDLSKLNRPNNTTLFLPTDEPFGEIEAVVTR
ncbi:factor-independent urate hydroxylase [Luteolibacter sp. AS25]|uniref:factor-independent urate hydroxylase n=1 Tax=Luteolibacter sp. AS25 TaxID=3135776 RepID=UPI00398A8DCA